MENNLEKVFTEVKPILQEYESDSVLKFDEPGKYYLVSSKLYKNRELYFGGVEIKKNYVSFHLVPVYMFPEMLENISPELKKRLTGKACFNFTKSDAKVFQDLVGLTRQSFEKFKQKGLI